MPREKELVTILQSENYLKDITNVLPKIMNNLSAQRFVINTLSAITSNDKIMGCSIQSIKRCVTNAATMGLVPGTRQCYLISYGTECTMQIGPDGYREIALRAGDIDKIYSKTVYAMDEFEYDPLNEEILKHVQKLENMTGEEADIVGVYAIALYKSGMKRLKVLSKKQVDKLRAKSKSGANGAWKDSFESMANTKAIKSLCNELPKTLELSTLIENDRDNELSSTNYVEGERVVATVEEKSNAAVQALKDMLPVKEEKKKEVIEEEAGIFEDSK